MGQSPSQSDGPCEHFLELRAQIFNMPRNEQMRTLVKRLAADVSGGSEPTSDGEMEAVRSLTLTLLYGYINEAESYEQFVTGEVGRYRATFQMEAMNAVGRCAGHILHIKEIYQAIVEEVEKMSPTEFWRASESESRKGIEEEVWPEEI